MTRAPDRPAVHAEISIHPVLSGQGTSFYIARALEAIGGMGLRYEINPMGTVIEAPDMATAGEAAARMVEAVHNLGVARVGATIRIDSRSAGRTTMEERTESVRRHLAGS